MTWEARLGLVFWLSALTPNALSTTAATSAAQQSPNFWRIWGRNHWIKCYGLNRDIDFFHFFGKVIYSVPKIPVTDVVLSSIAKFSQELEMVNKDLEKSFSLLSADWSYLWATG